jgi:ornithine carbamoyltransferase
MRKIIRTNGEEVQLDKPQSIADVEKLIGADVLDTVSLRDRVHVMLVDDLSHKKGLPINQAATELYWEKCGRPVDHVIRGDVVVVPDSDFGGM